MFWGYSNIAKQLGPDQPIYAFKSRGLDGLAEWPTIEAMATNYVADLRAQQAQGPYYIGGYCFGGVVAYEMARVLEAQGERVALLALISCSAPNSSYEQVPKPPTTRWTFQFLRNLGYWGTRFVFKWSVHERLEFVRWKFRLLSKRLFARSDDGSKAENTDVDQMVNIAAYTENQRQLWQSHVSALRNYVPREYGGRATLFRTRGHPLLCSFDEQFGWQYLAKGGVDLRVVAGGHGDILTEPHVATIARELTRELQAARATAAAREAKPHISVASTKQ
jgi:thioesterase domain-containing protein